jgi:hypothetical protein
MVTIGGAGQVDGLAKLASDGAKLRIMMKFNTPSYMGEDLVTDGSKVNVANLVASKATLLGPFFAERPSLLKEGLVGGTLTGNWLLADSKVLQLKLRYNGVKSVEGRSLHELEFEPRKDVGEIRIRLYLDTETYRHVLTVYETKRINQGSQSASVRGRSMTSLGSEESPISFKERFEDFQTVDGVTIPKKWTMDLSYDAKAASQLRWVVSVDDMFHGEIDAASFKTR